jgi:L-threonylcarbamoyladenylate synthase
VLDAVTGRRPTVGLRVPDQPLALELLGAFGEGVAAPSANRFGKVSPTTAEHVRGDLGADVDLVLDGGSCTVGVESTIVDCTTDPPTLLRPGGVSVDRLVEVLGSPVRTEAVGPSRAPGMMASHYAPRCRVEVVDVVAVAEERVAVLRSEGLTADLLAPSLGAEDYARHLYGWLRDADDRGLDVLVAVAPAGEGLGLAVRDRLTKAAAPRPTVEDAG